MIEVQCFYFGVTKRHKPTYAVRGRAVEGRAVDGRDLRRLAEFGPEYIHTIASTGHKPIRPGTSTQSWNIIDDRKGISAMMQSSVCVLRASSLLYSFVESVLLFRGLLCFLQVLISTIGSCLYNCVREQNELKVLSSPGVKWFVYQKMKMEENTLCNRRTVRWRPRSARDRDPCTEQLTPVRTLIFSLSHLHICTWGF